MIPQKLQKDFSVMLYEPYAYLSENFEMNMTPYVSNFRHRRRLIGGDWSASWDTVNMPVENMRNFFTRRIGSVVKEKAGAFTTWRGLIWEMEFYDRGVTRRISMDGIANKVKCRYTDIDNENERAITSWYSNSSSQGRYGVIEEIVNLDKVDSGTAILYANVILQENAFPQARVVSVKRPEKDESPYLKISCVGFVYTLNFQFLDITDQEYDLDNAITTALSAHGAYVSAGTIAANTAQVSPSDNDIKVWDWMKELNAIGDANYEPYQLQVDSSGRLSYKIIDPEPTIIWDGKVISSRIGDTSGTLKWQLKPGVMRDYTWPSSRLPSTGHLQNQRDTIIDEIEVNENNDFPTLKTTIYTDSDFISSYNPFQGSGQGSGFGFGYRPPSAGGGGGFPVPEPSGSGFPFP